MVHFETIFANCENKKILLLSKNKFLFAIVVSSDENRRNSQEREQLTKEQIQVIIFFLYTNRS